MQIQLSGALRDATGGVSEISIVAETIGELLRKFEERYPSAAPALQAGVAVSINGQIYRDDWNQSIPPDAEVFLLPRIPGG